MKTCSRCRKKKPYTLFPKDKSRKDGFNNNCKECCKKYRDKNKERYKIHSNEYRNKNKGYFKKYRLENKNKEKARNYVKKRRKNDSLYKLASNLRNRIHIVCKNNKVRKNKKTEQLLGASFKEVRDYLESLFKEGMTWENHGRCKDGNCDEVWHIDHKIPLSSANTKEELFELFYYTNLQPMWASENLEKGSKIII